MALAVMTKIRIGAPVHEVFDAIIDPKKLSQYFVSSASGPLEAGQTIRWEWADYNASTEVVVETVRKDHFIAFSWGGSGESTDVTIELQAETASVTAIIVQETGWDNNDKGIKRLTEQTQGWVEMLLCLKAFVKFGINLRKV